MEHPINNRSLSQSDDQNDEQAKLLFDAVGEQQSSINPFQNIALDSPVKIDKVKKLGSKHNKNKQRDSSHLSSTERLGKKQRKKRKKMRKLLAIKQKAANGSTEMKQEGKQRITKKNNMLLDSDQQEQKDNNMIKSDNTQKVENDLNGFKDQSQNLQSNAEDSDDHQFSEEFSNDESKALANLNPDLPSDDSDDKQSINSHRKRRLQKPKKKQTSSLSRKKRIMRQEGFDIRQLGNEGELNLQLNFSSANEDSNDESYSDQGNKKGRKKGKKLRPSSDKFSRKKSKKQTLTNQQLMEKLKEIGCQEDQDDENQADKKNYDSGLDQLHKMKSRKSANHKNLIKVQNRMFGNLDTELCQDMTGQQLQQQQKMELEFNAKKVGLSLSSSFLSKVQTFKKCRGIEADIDEMEFQKISKEKAKKSMNQLVNRITAQEVQQNEQIDLQVKIPSTVKGKNASLINNTMYIKFQSQKASQLPESQTLKQNVTENDVSSFNIKGEQPIQPNAVNSNNSTAPASVAKPQQQPQQTVSSVAAKMQKKSSIVSRADFFKNIRQSIQKKKSKYLTEEQLKNSFKQSKLEELQELRKQIEEKKKRQIRQQFGDFGDDNADDVINGLEDDLMKKKGISRGQVRRMINLEQGLEGLDDYDELQQVGKGKKSKNKSQCPEKRLKSSVQKQNGSGLDMKSSDQKQGQVQQMPDSHQQQSKQNNDQAQQQNKKIHADDMIQQIQQGVSASRTPCQQQMMIDEEDENENENEENLQQQQQQQGSQDQEDPESHLQNSIEEDDSYEVIADQVGQKQQINQFSFGLNNREETQQQKIERIRLAKQLQEEGILIPGARGRRQVQVQDQAASLIFGQNSLQHITNKDIQLQQAMSKSNKHSQCKQNQQNDYCIVEKPDKQTKPKLSVQGMSPEQQEENQLLDNQRKQDFKEFRKLRKIATVIQQKRKKRQFQMNRAKMFFEQQADLGSDNEEHDDQVKKINKGQEEDQYDGDDLDQQLGELIDNAVDINEQNENQAFKKYISDIKQKDRIEIQKILRGQFRKSNADGMADIEMEEDERNRLQRMEKMVERMRMQEEDDEGMYAVIQQDSDNEFGDGFAAKKKKKDRKANKKDLNEQESQYEDPEVLRKKLETFLEDSISPVKKSVQTDVSSEFLLDLPEFKKSIKSALNSASLVNKGITKIQSQTSVKTSQFSDSSSLLNLTGKKSQNNNLGVHKLKKTTSHLSQYLNKTKNQNRGSSASMIPSSSNKLPLIFGRALQQASKK